MERRRKMIVNRRSFIVKKGCSEKVVKLLGTVVDGKNKPVVRIYSGFISPSDQVVWEAEFENLEAYTKFSTEWTASKKRATILKKFEELTESGGSSEIWRVS
jgi:hypothetical protein